MSEKFLLTRPLRDVTPCSSFLSPELPGFLLTRPLRDVTARTILPDVILMISTHTPLAGRDPISQQAAADANISTHTPLAGRDCPVHQYVSGKFYFYSHAPCGT